MCFLVLLFQVEQINKRNIIFLLITIFRLCKKKFAFNTIATRRPLAAAVLKKLGLPRTHLNFDCLTCFVSQYVLLLSFVSLLLLFSRFVVFCFGNVQLARHCCTRCVVSM